ncbi:MAG TPA: SDR family oxidoreductase [Gemmatimonadales bacterium]|nr:SDR family oxidoreductase [Gemmatimonadales bacterium]
MNQNDLPVAIVTAASRGMGAACARHLADRGYRLALLARSGDVDALATELDAVSVKGSVTEPADLQRIVDSAMQHYGRIDVVVNNTGHAAKGGLLDITDAEWHAGVDLLLLNVIRMARLVTPIMLQQSSGAIVNISSFAAREPGLKHPVSATLRVALENLARLYSQQYAARGLRMNNVLPGWIDTYPVDAEIQKSIPAGRPGSAEEVARVVAFLASSEASYITGQSLLVDGGLVR